MTSWKIRNIVKNWFEIISSLFNLKSLEIVQNKTSGNLFSVSSVNYICVYTIYNTLLIVEKV